MAFTTFLLFYDQAPPLSNICSFKGQSLVDIKQANENEMWFTIKTSLLCTLFSCKKEKCLLNKAPICKQFFSSPNTKSLYGNANFEKDNVTLSQVYLNLIKLTKFIYMKVIICMKSTKN